MQNGNNEGEDKDEVKTNETTDVSVSEAKAINQAMKMENPEIQDGFNGMAAQMQMGNGMMGGMNNSYGGMSGMMDMMGGMNNGMSLNDMTNFMNNMNNMGQGGGYQDWNQGNKQMGNHYKQKYAGGQRHNNQGGFNNNNNFRGGGQGNNMGRKNFNNNNNQYGQNRNNFNQNQGFNNNSQQFRQNNNRNFNNHQNQHYQNPQFNPNQMQNQYQQQNQFQPQPQMPQQQMQQYQPQMPPQQMQQQMPQNPNQPQPQLPNQNQASNNEDQPYRSGNWSQFVANKKSPMYKTAICKWWENGTCKFGKFCKFAHGEEELSQCIPVHNKPFQKGNKAGQEKNDEEYLRSMNEKMKELQNPENFPALGEEAEVKKK